MVCDSMHTHNVWHTAKVAPVLPSPSSSLLLSSSNQQRQFSVNRLPSYYPGSTTANSPANLSFASATRRRSSCSFQLYDCSWYTFRRLVVAPVIHFILAYLALAISAEGAKYGRLSIVWPANGCAIHHLSKTKSWRHGVIELAMLMVGYIVAVLISPTERTLGFKLGILTSHILEISVATCGIRRNPLSTSKGEKSLNTRDLRTIFFSAGFAGPFVASICTSLSFIFLSSKDLPIGQDIFEGCVLWIVRHAASNMQLVWSLSLLSAAIPDLAALRYLLPQHWSTSIRVVEFGACLVGIVLVTYFAAYRHIDDLYLLLVLLVSWVSSSFSQVLNAAVQLFTFFFVIFTEYTHLKDGFSNEANLQLNIVLYTTCIMSCYVSSARFEMLSLINHVTSLLRESNAQYKELKKTKEDIEIMSKQSLLFAFMSHEFKTPISCILGFSHELRHLSLEKKAVEFINHIMTLAEGLLELTSDMLDMVRLRAGKDTINISPVDLHEVFNTTAAKLMVLARNNGVGLISYIADDAPRMIMADKMRLAEVMNNIGNNAIKFSADKASHTPVSGGTMSRINSGQSFASNGDAAVDEKDNPFTYEGIQMHQQEEKQQRPCCTLELLLLDDKLRKELNSNEGTWVITPPFSLRKSADSPCVVLRVTDTGKGIPPSLHKAIFNVYERVGTAVDQMSVPNTGLGLMLVKELLENMQAGIHLKSSVGSGSSFSIILQAQVNHGIGDIDMNRIINAPGTYGTLTRTEKMETGTARIQLSVSVKNPPSLITQLSGEGDNSPRIASRTCAEDEVLRTSAQISDASASCSITSLNVLVAEDTPINQKLIAAILKRQGHTYQIAANGRIALDLILKNDAQHVKPFDCIILDLFMPFLSGEEFLKCRHRELPGHLANIPVCVVSASINPGQRERLLQMPGVVAVLEKPYRPALIQAILIDAARAYSTRIKVPD